jgi:hypothetical protein
MIMVTNYNSSKEQFDRATSENGTPADGYNQSTKQQTFWVRMKPVGTEGVMRIVNARGRESCSQQKDRPRTISDHACAARKWVCRLLFYLVMFWCWRVFEVLLSTSQVEMYEQRRIPTTLRVGLQPLTLHAFRSVPTLAEKGWRGMEAQGHVCWIFVSTVIDRLSY